MITSLAMLQRLPARARTTAAFAAVTAVLFLLIGVGLYAITAAALLDELDTGLRFRAVSVQDEVRLRVAPVDRPAAGLAEPGEQLQQVLSVDGEVLQSSRPGPVLTPAAVGAVRGPTVLTRQLPGVTGPTRLLAVPGQVGDQPVVLVVGASMQDRADALHFIGLYLGIAGPLALLLASVAGWYVAGRALRPVERMRREAAAVAVSGLDRRLAVPPARDEISRLASTLNEMLGRLAASFAAERRFLDDASHELRSPLAVLKAELDLALARPRSLDELRAALFSASQEADHVARLADDLLLLSRLQQGELPMHRTAAGLDGLVGAAAGRCATRATAAGVRLVHEAPDALVMVDEVRVRQVLDNLLDNALRHCAPGGLVSVRAEAIDGCARLVVADDGPGFPAGFTEQDVRPFASRGAHNGTGLGLVIVRAVAQAHGGTLVLDAGPGGGARATVLLPNGATAGSR